MKWQGEKGNTYQSNKDADELHNIRKRHGIEASYHRIKYSYARRYNHRNGVIQRKNNRQTSTCKREAPSKFLKVRNLWQNKMTNWEKERKVCSLTKCRKDCPRPEDFTQEGRYVQECCHHFAVPFVKRVQHCNISFPAHPFCKEDTSWNGRKPSAYMLLPSVFKLAWCYSWFVFRNSNPKWIRFYLFPTFRNVRSEKSVSSTIPRKRLVAYPTGACVHRRPYPGI